MKNSDDQVKAVSNVIQFRCSGPGGAGFEHSAADAVKYFKERAAGRSRAKRRFISRIRELARCDPIHVIELQSEIQQLDERVAGDRMTVAAFVEQHGGAAEWGGLWQIACERAICSDLDAYADTGEFPYWALLAMMRCFQRSYAVDDYQSWLHWLM